MGLKTAIKKAFNKFGYDIRKLNITLAENVDKQPFNIAKEDIDKVINIYSFTKGDLNGISLLLTEDYYKLFESGYHDKEMIENFKSQSLKNKIIFDVGGFMGISSLLFANAMPSVKKILCFEPNPWNYERISNNFSNNKELSKSIELYKIALGDKNDVVEMLMSKSIDNGYSSTSQLINGDGTNISKQKLFELGFFNESVSMKTLDNFVHEKNIIPDVIKIDIEGAESYFLSGAAQTLQNYNPLLYIEFHSIIATLRSVCMLCDYGYKITILNQESDGRVIVVAEQKNKRS